MTIIKTKYRLLRLHEVDENSMFDVKFQDESYWHLNGHLSRKIHLFNSKSEALEWAVKNNIRGEFTLLEVYECSGE